MTTKVMVRPKVNPKTAERLMAAGVRRVHQIHQEKNARHERAAVDQGLDPYRFGRTDAAGKQHADSGVPVFGREGAKDVELGALLTDLREAGYHLMDIHLVEKQGDRMLALVLTFVPDAAKEIVPSSVVSDELARIFGATYGFLHVWENPDGSVTVNPAHKLDRAPPATQTLRVTRDGAHLRFSVE